MNALQDSLSRLIERLGLFFLVTMPTLMFCGIALCDASITAIALLFLVRSLLTNDFSWMRARWIQVGLVLWGYIVIISFHAAMNVNASLSQAIPFGRFIFFGAGLQYWLLKSPDYRRYMLYALIVALLVMTVNTLFSFLTGLSLLGKSAIQYGYYHHIAWVWHRPYGRIMGINGKKSAGIMLTWIAMPALAAVVTLQKEHKAYFYAALAGFCAVVFAIAVTGDRMALLECGLGCLLLFLFLPILRMPFLLLTAALVALLGVAFLFEPGLYQRNVTSLVQEFTHFSQGDYAAVIKTTTAIVYHYPVFGAGLKQYAYLTLLPTYFNTTHPSTHAQNIYLEWLTDAGCVGLILFVSLLFLWCRQLFKQRAVIYASPVAIGVFVAFLLRVWPLASTTSFFFSWGAITFWWMGAWLLAITDTRAC